MWANAAVRSSVLNGLVPASLTHCLVINQQAVRETVRDLRSAFPPSTLHTFAAKANAIDSCLKVLAEEGMGCEAASFGEFTMASRVFPKDMIVYDSPVKTRSELEQAIYEPCFLNVDNFQELAVIEELHKQKPVVACIGLRVNPQVGAGSMTGFSTATNTSKFGVGLEEEHDRILEAYARNPFLRMIHVHSGSQCLTVATQVEGIRRVFQFVEENLKEQISTVDIGGGLSVNFASDEVKPTFSEYAGALKVACPSLFSGNVRIVTEFGRAIMAKHGIFLSRVEYTKSAGGRHIALQHLGADLLLRTVWAPNDWPLRVTVHRSSDGADRDIEEGCERVLSDIAGPCCIASDLVAKERLLPRAEPGDVVVVRDVGAYYFSSWNYYNLRQAPPVYWWHSAGEHREGRLELVRSGDTVEDTLRFMEGKK